MTAGGDCPTIIRKKFFTLFRMTCLGDIKISRSGGQIIFYHRLGLDWNRLD